jgi:hypothetical protein
MTSINSILRGRRPLACMEIPCARTGIPHRPLQISVERVGKVKPKPTMNDGEESDNSIVPTKRLNKIKENYGGNRGGKGVDQGECDST